VWNLGRRVHARLSRSLLGRRGVELEPEKYKHELLYVMKLLTNGWPRGSTLGPWREWHETMSTSSGRCFSKAAISGALQEVCPPTIAPCLVAVKNPSALRHTVLKKSYMDHTERQPCQSKQPQRCR
jgi:hypothetical protein